MKKLIVVLLFALSAFGLSVSSSITTANVAQVLFISDGVYKLGSFMVEEEKC